MNSDSSAIKRKHQAHCQRVRLLTLKQATLKPTPGLHATALLRAFEGGDGLALVDRLDALIWEFAKATVGTVKAANLLGQASTGEEPLDVRRT